MNDPSTDMSDPSTGDVEHSEDEAEEMDIEDEAEERSQEMDNDGRSAGSGSGLESNAQGPVLLTSEHSGGMADTVGLFT